MNLTQANELLLRYLGRGSSFTAQAMAALRQAALWIEQNNTLTYMQRVGTVTVRADADRPRVVAFPTHRLKAFRFARAVLDSGEFQYILKVDPSVIASISGGIANYFYLDGMNSMILDATPSEDYDIELAWVEYTDWPVTASLPEGISSWEPWLLTNGEPALIAQAMVILGTSLRDDGLIARWQLRRDEGMKALLNAEYELSQGNADNRVIYGT